MSCTAKPISDGVIFKATRCMFLIWGILAKQLNQPMLILLWERDDPSCHGISQSLGLFSKNGAAVFSQYSVCYGQEARVCLKPVMAFPCRGTDVSQLDARLEKSFLKKVKKKNRRGTCLAMISQTFVALTLSSTCPVSLLLCLWAPLLLTEPRAAWRVFKTTEVFIELTGITAWN